MNRHQHYTDLGYVRGTLAVYIFHDTHDHLPWWSRDCERVGEIRTMLDGTVPADPKEVLRVARETFGEKASVLW